tara:strand:+ start:596 stop:1060 length:465 start_codon:yes stop_codon:yes gene_type:complete
MKIIDSWLDTDLNNFLEQLFLYKTPHNWGHVSNIGKDLNMFYNTDLNPNEPITSFLINKFKKILPENYLCKRVYINIQHPGMNGTFHRDDGEITGVYMVTGEGDFQIKNLEKLDTIDFKKNRLIYFDSNKTHRGLAPKKGVRITLAFKMSYNKK